MRIYIKIQKVTEGHVDLKPFSSHSHTLMPNNLQLPSCIKNLFNTDMKVCTYLLKRLCTRIQCNKKNNRSLSVIITYITDHK